jgi:hypothetical protein
VQLDDDAHRSSEVQKNKKIKINTHSFVPCIETRRKEVSREADARNGSSRWSDQRLGRRATTLRWKHRRRPRLRPKTATPCVCFVEVVLKVSARRWGEGSRRAMDLLRRCRRKHFRRHRQTLTLMLMLVRTHSARLLTLSGGRPVQTKHTVLQRKHIHSEYSYS